MATTTPVSQLIINKLTKEQYNALEYKDPYQLYMITDGTSTALTLGSWVSTTRTDIPYGLLRADGKCYSSELSSGDVPIYYTKDYFPSLWSALENGTIRSVGTYTFEKTLETNGWCGVFGFGKEEVTQKFYSWGGLYWLLSETPKTGDRAYDANGEETDRTVTVADDGSVTFVQDVSGGTVSGLARDSSSDYSITQTLGRDDVFYMPKVTNHEQQNITPENDGSNKNLGRILVAEQIPTAENLYRWYKLYSDGWVEQGGYFDVAATSGTVTLQIQMVNSHYVVTTSEYESASTDTGGIDLAVMLSQYTTTSFYFSQASTARNANWVLYGYANTTKIPGFRAPEDNFLIQAYNSNKEVTISDYITILQEYKEETIKPDIYNYSEGLKPELQEYVDEAQAWATSDTIVDEAKNVYSAKWYAEQSEKNSTGFPILYPHWSDRILNDARWLGADDFSWHSGDVYVAAYNHLADDMSLSSSNNKMTIKGTEYYVWDGGSGTDYYTLSETPVRGDETYMLNSGVVQRVKFLVVSFDGTTLRVEDENTGRTSDWSKKSLSGVNAIETIGDITIQYYQTEDGHKICLPDQEANLIALYETARVAWYFILDTENKQFKLPRELPLYAGHAPIYGNTARQGDGNGAKGAPLLASTDNVSGSKGITTGGSSGTAGVEFYVGFQQIENAYADVSALRAANDGSQKYLYFYVGNHLENLDTINVGHLTEVINDFDPETFRDEVNEIKTVATQEINETTQESISTLKNMGEVVNYTNITNCITEIPQDIKLELSSDGVLTLKAGSKVYIPNGPGVFDSHTIPNDITVSSWGGGMTDSTLFVQEDKLIGEQTIFCYSGTTSPTTTNATSYWYDTTNNQMKRSGDTGSTWSVLENCSLPICIIKRNSGVITSIAQVFNGFGYIGSTIFALPGVKGLVPNGRNADGTLKNIEITLSTVRYMHMESWMAGRTNAPLTLDPVYAVTGMEIDYTYWGSVTYLKDLASVYKYYSMWYCAEDNKMHYFNENAVESIRQRTFIGSFNVDSNNKITSLNIKQSFHSVDYNDTEFITNQAMPSERFTTLPLGASASTYIAPANGWFYMSAVTTAVGQFVILEKYNKNAFRVSCYATNSGYWVSAVLPVSKGEMVAVEYNYGGTLRDFGFRYANGSK